MKFALGKKDRMTQIFSDEGYVQPVTRVVLHDMKITSVKSHGRDGYSAVQVGYGHRKESRISKPVLGTTKEGYEGLKEFIMPEKELSNFKVGDKIDGINVLNIGDVVFIAAKSKGKGFQGVVKRHGFHGSKATHGQKHTLRAPGSIGCGLNRVWKGVRMGGRMGNDRVTTKGVCVLGVEKETNTILLSGSVPGKRGTLVEIRI